MLKRLLAVFAFAGIFATSLVASSLNAYASSAYTYNAYDAWFTKAVNYSQNIPFTGKNITVAVIDTGIDGTHPVLKDNVINGFDAANFRELEVGTKTDHDGHGTHVAGIVHTFAPDALLMPVRVFGAALGGVENPIAPGIYWAADNGANVINMSLATTLELGESSIKSICDAAKYAIAKGVVVVAAAGNDGSFENPQIFPSACEGVISVAAVNESLNPSWFSSYDSTVVVAAPGSNVTSTVPLAQAVNYNVLGYNSFSGTSMASPVVAGAAALLLESGVKPSEVENVLVASATDIAPSGFDPFTGYGVINFAKMFNIEKAVTPQVASIEIVSKYAENNQAYVSFRPSVSLANPNYVLEVYNIAKEETQTIHPIDGTVRFMFEIVDTDLTVARVVDLNSNMHSAYAMIPNQAFAKRAEIPLELNLEDIFNIPVEFTKNSYSNIKDIALMPEKTENGFSLKIILAAPKGTYEISAKQYPKISAKVKVTKAYGATEMPISKKDYKFFRKLNEYWKVSIEKI